jgi:hypothetical protein
MTQVVLPYRPAPNDPEDVTQIMADFDAIVNVLNGGIKNDNIAADAAIGATKVAAIPGSQIVFSRGTTPPASPQDGDLWQCVADAAAGVNWLFRYNAGSASAYKWEYIGGVPIRAFQGANDNTNSTTYTALATPGPSVAIPRPGDYDIMLAFGYNNMTAGTAVMSYDIGAVPASDSDCLAVGWAGANAGISMPFYGINRKLGLTAVTLTAKYKVGAGSTYFSGRTMHVTPVRVS